MGAKGYRSGHAQDDVKRIKPLRSRAPNVIQRGYRLGAQGIIGGDASKKRLNTRQGGHCGQRLQFVDGPIPDTELVVLDEKPGKAGNNDMRYGGHCVQNDVNITKEHLCSQHMDLVLPPRSTSTPIKSAIPPYEEHRFSLPPRQQSPLLLQNNGPIVTPLFCFYHSNSQNYQILPNQDVIQPQYPNLPSGYNFGQGLLPTPFPPISQDTRPNFATYSPSVVQPCHMHLPACCYPQYLNNHFNSVVLHEQNQYQPSYVHQEVEEREESDVSPSYTSSGGNATCSDD